MAVVSRLLLPMSDVLASERSRAWQEMLEQAQPADWVRQMSEYYWRHGKFRPEDLNRLLGDPTKGVEVGPYTSLSTMYSARNSG
jgi:hypothetical protein